MTYSPAAIAALNAAALALVRDMDAYADRLYPDDRLPAPAVLTQLRALDFYTAQIVALTHTPSPDDHRTARLINRLHVTLLIYERLRTRFPAPHIKNN